MKTVRGDLWTYPADVRIITTNGDVRKDGCAVMGRGCAREAAYRFVMLPRELGVYLRKYGNHVTLFPKYNLMTFPVKHHWDEDADLTLITRSAKELERFLLPQRRFLMPRAGCGNGRLQWEDVKTVLETLPDNVYVITNE